MQNNKDVSEGADLRLFLAKSEHGKTYRLMKTVNGLMKGVNRLLVWDIMAQYGGTVVTDRAELILAISKKRFKVAYRPVFKRGVKEEFDFFCRAAWAAGNMVLVIEELNKVTHANYAPPAWQELSSRGRHRAIKILATSQRTTFDKDALANATEIHAGRMRYRRDRLAIAEAFDDPELTNKLAHLKKWTWIVLRDE